MQASAFAPESKAILRTEPRRRFTVKARVVRVKALIESPSSLMNKLGCRIYPAIFEKFMDAEDLKEAEALIVAQ